MSIKGRAWLTVLAACTLVAALGLFGGAPALHALGRTVFNLGAAALLLGAAMGLGALLLPLFRLEMDPSRRVLFSAGLGTGALSAAICALAGAGLLSPAPVLTVLSVGLVLAVKKGGAIFRFDGGRGGAEKVELAERAAIVALALVAALGISLAATAPASRDALIHHLAIPKIYIGHRGFVDLPFATFSYYPMNLNMLYAALLLAGADIAAKMIHFAFYLGVLFALHRMLRLFCSPAVSMACTALFGSVPVVFNVATWAYVDFGLTFYTLLAIMALLDWMEKGEVRWVWLTAVLSGLAAGTKYSGFLIAGLLGCWVIAAAFRQHLGPVKVLRTSAAFVGIVLAVLLPWLIKDMVQTGNPIYPQGSGIFGGPAWQPERARVSAWEARREGEGERWIEEVLVPWRISTVMRPDAPSNVDGVLGPLFLVGAVLFIGLRKKPAALGYVGAMALFFFLCMWARGSVRSRYLIPVLAPLTLLCGYAAERLLAASPRGGRWGRMGRWGIGVAAVIFFAFHGWWLLRYAVRVDPLPFLSGAVSRAEYLRGQIPDYDCYEFINEKLPPEAKLFFLYVGNDGYYCDRDYIYDTYFLGYTVKQMIREASDPEAIRSAFREMGVTHLFINWPLLRRNFNETLAPEEIDRFDRFAGLALRPLYRARLGHEEIFELR